MDDTLESLPPPAKKQKTNEDILEECKEEPDSVRNESKTEDTENVTSHLINIDSESTGESLSTKTDKETADCTSASDCDQESVKNSSVKDVSEESKVENKPDVQTRILETDVGIHEYISSYPGFQAVIKQRFDLFLFVVF